MNLVCFGASVTAQSTEAGYFQQLLRSSSICSFSSVQKVAFGASHFEYAGYGFIQDVLDMEPDVCIIDWLTPSMKGFSEYKIHLLNWSLLEIGAFPIWFFFLGVVIFITLQMLITKWLKLQISLTYHSLMPEKTLPTL